MTDNIPETQNNEITQDSQTRSLSTRLSFWIVGLSAFLLVSALGMMFYTARTAVMDEAEKGAFRELGNTVLRVNSIIDQVEVAANNMEGFVLKSLDNPDVMYEYARNLVENNPLLIGASISFEPYYYKDKGRYYSIYANRYGDSVRVVSMGDFSKELCGGTHVKNTNEIVSFKIVSEGGISAGVRRIEAITAANVTTYYKKLEEELKEAAKAAKCAPDALAQKIASMQDEMKSLASEVEKLKAKIANSSLGDILNSVKETNGVKVLCASIPDADMNGLRNLSDQLKEKLGDCLILLASAADGKVSLVSMATDGAIAKGAHAGNLIKECAALVGGGGGGRPNMAQAGGKNPAGIDACIQKGFETAAKMLG